MQTIQAVSVGVRVPQGSWQAVVHSVFRTTINLQVKGLDYLVVLLAGRDIDLPQGIRLPGESEQSLRKFQPGQMVTGRAGVLRAAAADLEIRLDGAQQYSSDVALLNAVTFSSAANAAWRAARDALVARQAETQADIRLLDLEQRSSTTLTGQKAGAQIRAVTTAAQNFEMEPAQAAVRALAGLGVGLTPAGDDVLVGFLAGFWAAAGQVELRKRWVAGFGEAVRAASRGTNDISRSYMVLAAGGQFSSSLSSLTAAVCRGTQVELVQQAAEQVFQTGHSSGMDAATGLLAGLSAWNPQS